MSKQSTESSSEKRNYSVDEMMARLREGDREKRQQDESELVTRPDGTQVLRVRRRKRRSKQPVVETRKRAAKSRKFVIPLVLGLVLLMGVALVLLVAKYNSKGFQDGLESQLEELSGAKTSIARMVVTPIKVRAQSVQSTWQDGGMVESLELTGLEADLKWTSFLRGALAGDRIQAGRGVLRLGPGRAGLVPGEAPSGSPSGSPSVGYDELRCQLFDAHFGDEKASGAMLKHCEATLVKPEGGAAQIRFRGGDLIIAGWDPLEVDLGMGQFTNAGFELVSFRVAPQGGGGEMNLTSIAPLQSGRPMQLNLQMTEFPLETVLGPGLGRMFSGSVNATAGSIVFGNDNQPRADVRIEFSGHSGGMQGLPVLENLRTILGDTDYGRPEFGSIQGVFRRSATGEELQGLVLESKGQLIIRGLVEHGTEGLSGTLELGIAQDKVITSTGRKRNNVFSDPREGFCWVTLTLSGTAERPEDNFKILLQKSAREASERREVTPSGDRFDELTQPR